MKPTKWAETIVWKSYPECNANLIVNKRYLVKFRDGYVTEDKWLGNGLTEKWYNSVDSNITAFAELPTGIIGDEFDFATAVLLMKEGVYCSPISDNLIVKHKSYTICNMNGELHFSVGNNTQSVNISASEILGKWRLA